MTIRGPFAYVLIALLIASLAVNFLVLGFAAARYHAYDDAGTIDRIVTLGARAFPRELRDDISHQLGRHRGELRAALRDLGDARREMLRRMAAEPLDRDALDAAFRNVRDKTNTLQRLGQELVEDVVVNASPEDRAKIRTSKRWQR